MKIQVQPINIVSPEQCTDMIARLPDDYQSLDNQQRYELFLARQYFINHQRQFNYQQKESILEKKCFFRNITKKMAEDFLEKAVFSKEKLPVVIDSWFTNIENLSSLLDGYLGLIATDAEQIKRFCLKAPDFTFQYYKKNNSPYLTDGLMEHHLPAILYNKTWSDQKISDWFDSHRSDALEVVLALCKHGTNLQGPSLQKMLDYVVDTIIGHTKSTMMDIKPIIDENNTMFSMKTGQEIGDPYFCVYGYSLIDFFKRMPHEISETLQRKDKKLFDKIASLHFTENCDNHNYSTSFYQALYTTQLSFNPLSARSTLRTYQEEIEKPVVMQHHFYLKDISYHEYLLASGKHKVFRDIEIDSPETERLYIAAHLSYLESSFNFSVQSPDLPETIDSLFKADYKVIEQCLQFVQSDMSEKLYTLVSNLLLKQKLDNEMAPAHLAGRSMKI